MRLIVLTGMPGSGKEEFLNVAREEGWPFIRMGDVVRSHYHLLDAKEEGLSVGDFAQRERDIHGYNVWAVRAAESMGDSDAIVDGCRGPAEVEAFRSLGHTITVMAVHSSPSDRFVRLQKRSRYDAPRNVEEFNSRDRQEMSWGLAEVIALADVMIVNDADLESYHQAVRGYLGGLNAV